MNKKIAVVGGDARTVRAASELASMGYEVAMSGLDIYTEDIGDAVRCAVSCDAIRSACAVMLPIPYSLDAVNVNAPFSKKSIALADVCSAMSDGQLLLGGCFDGGFMKRCVSAGFCVYDYFEREDLKILNAIPTAEGAVAIAVENTDFTVHGSKCAVISYGKVGEALAKILLALGAEVTVAARKYSSRAKAFAAGCRAVGTDDMAKTVAESDIVFNAAPARLIGKPELEASKKSALFVDLASKPGGIDLHAAEELGRKAVWALSLPNKCAPVTAGKYLAHAVDNIIRSVD